MRSTPRNLFMSALLGGRRGERPPVGNPTSIACHDLMDAAGVSFPEAHLEAEAMARLALAGHQVAGFDVVMPEYSVLQEAAALGSEVNWGHCDMMPDTSQVPYADLGPIEVPENLLEKPSIKVVLDAISILRRQVGDRAAIVGKVMGPWTISYHTAGVQNFLLQVGKAGRDPERKAKVERMLDALMPVTIAHANAQFRAGADAVVLADHATGNLVSPKTYEEYLLKRHQIVTREIGGPMILHVCGDCRDRVELFSQAGFDAYHFEWILDAKKVVEQVGERISLVGCISCAQELFSGTPEQVYEQARYAIAAGVDIIAPECAIALETPLANLKAIVAAAAEGY